VPSFYFLYLTNTPAAKIEIVPTAVESMFDAVEMAAALVIVTQFTSEMTSVDLAETIICFVCVFFLLISSILDVKYLRRISNLETKTAKEAKFEIMHHKRSSSSFLMLLVLIPEMILELLIFAQYERFTDLVVLMVLALDCGSRLNMCVGIIQVVMSRSISKDESFCTSFSNTIFDIIIEFSGGSAKKNGDNATDQAAQSKEMPSPDNDHGIVENDHGKMAVENDYGKMAVENDHGKMTRECC